MAADLLKSRAEDDIFADLGRLCRSPGFVHAIAHMCMRDNMIGYVGEATADDMSKLYTADKLLRNEINALLGLLVKDDIDFLDPGREVIERYIVESRKLSDEIHQAMNLPLLASMKALFQENADSAVDPTHNGTSMREAIYYGQESAYAFQYRDFAPLKYGADRDWLVKKMGFSMNEAAIVARAAAKIIDEQASFGISQAGGDFDKLSSPLDVFTLTLERVSSAAKLPVETCERILSAFSYPTGDRNEKFTRVDMRNTAAILPIHRRDGRYLLFNAVDLYEVLYQAPYFWMLGDKSYGPTAADNRGRFTEEFAQNRLASVFGSDRALLNVKMMRSNTVAGEIDVLVIFSKLAIVLQAKSKQLTAAARQGNESQIHADFAAAVQDACDQGMDCAQMLFDPAIKLVGPDGKSIEPPPVEKVFVVCLVADHYPALAAQTRNFLKFEPVDKVASPLVMDVFLLDAMAEMLDSPLQFLNYLDRRCLYANELLSSHELNILGYHLSHNLWMDRKANLFHLGDDFGIDLELSMLARRDGLASAWTPPGVLTHLENTALGKLVRSIERRPDPGMVDLGFAILGMSGNTLKQASDAINELTRRSRLDGRPHDFTVQLEDGVGLTFHSSPWSNTAARDYLLSHCVRRKYVSRGSRWFGVVVNPNSGDMQFGVMLDSPWVKDDQLELATSHMSRKSNVSRADLRSITRPRTQPKVGRNDPCVCGSGKKSKRCCAT